MECKCPSCGSSLIKRNGLIHNGKQNHRCLACHRQFILNPQQKIIDDQTKSLVRKTLLERVSLEGICRIFDVSMPWLLGFIDEIVAALPPDLNAQVLHENDDIEVVLLEADEQWSYVGSKENPQWLWLVMHSKTRQIVGMQVGKRDKQTAEKLFAKLPEPLKKKPSITLTTSVYIMKPSPQSGIDQSEKSLGKRLTLKDLTAPSDSVVPG